MVTQRSDGLGELVVKDEKLIDGNWSECVRSTLVVGEFDQHDPATEFFHNGSHLPSRQLLL